MKWTQKNSIAAELEGWNVFSSFGSENGDWQIQKVDDPDDGMPRFESDNAVWLHVYRRAGEGSQLHKDALAYVKEHNRMEYDSIMKYVVLTFV